MFEFWRFKTYNTDEMVKVVGDFDYALIFLSVSIASLAAYSVLIIIERIWASSNRSALDLWLWFGACVMGIGVWAMHFTGMLAFMIPLPMSFEPWITLASVFPPILGAYVALRVLALRMFSILWIQIGSLSLASGIGTMHYVGMEAMVVDAVMQYDFFLFVGSICVAHILATIALYVRVLVKTGEGKGTYLRVLSAFVMGCAVSGMHYTGMAAVSYYVSVDTILVHDMESSQSMVFALLIFLTVIVFSGITAIGTLVDKRFQEAKNDLFIHSVREHTVVETLADALIIIDHKGNIETADSTC